MRRVPGEQSWVKEELCGPVAIHEQLANLEITSSQQKPMLPELPDSVHGKYPIPGLGGNYAGLLLKASRDIRQCLFRIGADHKSSRRYMTQKHLTKLHRPIRLPVSYRLRHFLLLMTRKMTPP
jgi:hypothetical protein